MAKTKISEFNANPALNTDIDSINIAEGCAPSGINDAIRELMAQLKDFQTGAQGDSFGGPVNGALNGTIGATTPNSGSFTTLTSSSSITHTDGTANGVLYLNGSKVVKSGTAIVFDGTNFGVGVTPSAWGSAFKAAQIGVGASLAGRTANYTQFYLIANSYYDGSNFRYLSSAPASYYHNDSGAHYWFNAPSGTAGATATFTQAMTLDANNNLMLGTTSTYLSGRLISYSASGNNGVFVNDDSTSSAIVNCWGNQGSGNQRFVRFSTDSNVERGTITYNRGAGITVYNTTSDYRAKTVNGLVQNALSKVALLKPSTGRMNDAEYDIDFFVAHELKEVVPSAVTGEKDAVNEDNTPMYQMVDKSALIPLLTAAIQELNAKFEAYKASHP